MIHLDTARQLALSLPQAEETPHFEKPSFRVKKKIFAVLHPAEKKVVLRLSPADQSVFTDFDREVFHPVKGRWGARGWTEVELRRVRKEVFREALLSAWLQVAPKAAAKMLAALVLGALGHSDYLLIAVMDRLPAPGYF